MEFGVSWGQPACNLRQEVAQNFHENPCHIPGFFIEFNFCVLISRNGITISYSSYEHPRSVFKKRWTLPTNHHRVHDFLQWYELALLPLYTPFKFYYRPCKNCDTDFLMSFLRQFGRKCHRIRWKSHHFLSKCHRNSMTLPYPKTMSGLSMENKQHLDK